MVRDVKFISISQHHNEIMWLGCIHLEGPVAAGRAAPVS